MQQHYHTRTHSQRSIPAMLHRAVTQQHNTAQSLYNRNASSEVSNISLPLHAVHPTLLLIPLHLPLCHATELLTTLLQCCISTEKAGSDALVFRWSGYRPQYSRHLRWVGVWPAEYGSSSSR